jgi:hypothetical protein
MPPRGRNLREIRCLPSSSETCFATGNLLDRRIAYPSEAELSSARSSVNASCRRPECLLRRCAKRLRPTSHTSGPARPPPAGEPPGTGRRRPWTRRPPSLSIFNEPWDSTGLNASGNPLRQTLLRISLPIRLPAAAEPCSWPLQADLSRITLNRPG